MPVNPLQGFARGMVVGLVGGLLAGGIEAVSLVRDAPTGRAALIEAGLYAIVVDALALVFPVQVLMEARHANAPSGGAQGLRPIDPSALESDYSADLAAAFARTGTGPADRPVNVLLLTVDALRADHVGACGNDWIQTPTMDLLAAHAAVSCSTFTQQPQTNPALASLFTSTYPWVHGVRVHMVDRLSESFDTLAKV